MIQKNQHNPSTALMLAVSTGIKCLRDKKIVYASLYSVHSQMTGITKEKKKKNQQIIPIFQP